MKIAVDNALIVQDVAELAAIDHLTLGNGDKRVIENIMYVYYLNATYGIKPDSNNGVLGRWVQKAINYDVFEAVPDDYDFASNNKTEIVGNSNWVENVVISKQVEDEKLIIKDLTEDPIVLSKNALSINYKTELDSSLYAERTFQNGFLTLVEYYADEPKTKLCLTVEVDYQTADDAQYEAGKTVLSRTTTRKWFRRNGRVDNKDIKVTTKNYEHIIEKNQEGKRRRANIFNIAAGDLVICLMASETFGDQESAEQLALAFAGQYESQLATFVDVAAVAQIVDAFNNDVTFMWLDNELPNNPLVTSGLPNAIVGETIRNYMVRSFKGEL